MQSLQEFLTESQREALVLSILSIQNRLTKLPTRYTLILQACQEENTHYISQIDPEGSLLLERITKFNEDALYKEFHEIGETLTKLITQNMQIYEKQHSLIFLKEQISREVNMVCDSTQFRLRIDSGRSRAGDTLWQTLHGQLVEVSMGITGFMHRNYEMRENQERRELQINYFLQSFRDKFQGKARLSKIYVLAERLEKDMVQLKNQSMIIDNTEVDEWMMVMEQIDPIQKELDQKEIAVKIIQEEMQIQPIEDSQNSKPNNSFGKKFKNTLQNTFQNTFKSVKKYISNNSSYEQKQINSIQLEENLEHHLQNLQTHMQIPQPSKREIQKMTTMTLNQLENALHGQFDEQELSIIEYGIQSPIKKWNEQQISMGTDSVVYNSSICRLLAYSSQLHSVLERLQSGGRGSEMGEYLLVGLLYRVLEKDYCPFAKRYLMKVLRNIENELGRNSRAYLRGALRIFETSTIQPTEMATLLSSLRPSRSKEFEQSYQSMIYFQNNHFENEARLLQETEDCLHKIKKQQALSDQIPQISFARLSLSPPTKTVTIVISGFLSEDSAKDLEWMGLIRALQDTELYSLTWKSSTLKETGLYVADLAKDLVLNPVNLIGSVGIVTNLARIGLRVVNQYKSNPFATAHARAKAVGKYFAEFICKVFPDRFINLVGFSLGTEVISHCLNRLAERGQLGMINKIVMMGSAANRKNVQNLLEKAPSSLELLNLWSEGDYSIRYIYRLCRLGSVALGAGNLPPVSGHEVVNINCSKFVKSHMDFRCNLYGIGLLTGLIHD